MTTSLVLTVSADAPPHEVTTRVRDAIARVVRSPAQEPEVNVSTFARNTWAVEIAAGPRSLARWLNQLHRTEGARLLHEIVEAVLSVANCVGLARFDEPVGTSWSPPEAAAERVTIQGALEHLQRPRWRGWVLFDPGKSEFDFDSVEVELAQPLTLRAEDADAVRVVGYFQSLTVIASDAREARRVVTDHVEAEGDAVRSFGEIRLLRRLAEGAPRILSSTGRAYFP